MTDHLMTTRQIAEQNDIKFGTVSFHVKKGFLRNPTLGEDGKTHLFKPEDVTAYLEQLKNHKRKRVYLKALATCRKYFRHGYYQNLPAEIFEAVAKILAEHIERPEGKDASKFVRNCFRGKEKELPSKAIVEIYRVLQRYAG